MLRDIDARDIGIIAPYRQQCVKIRKLLNDNGYGAIDVKVTEDWQGQVRRI
jgi:superfamily I DNA and/or RNA helicase